MSYFFSNTFGQVKQNHLGIDYLSCIWHNFQEFWSLMLFNFVLYLAFLTCFDLSCNDESFEDETRVWRKYVISILVSMTSLLKRSIRFFSESSSPTCRVNIPILFQQLSVNGFCKNSNDIFKPAMKQHIIYQTFYDHCGLKSR